jgi:hypothetical protein
MKPCGVAVASRPFFRVQAEIVSFPSELPAFIHLVEDVIGVRPDPKMSRVDTGGIVAAMEDMGLIEWDLAESKEPRHSMGTR